MPYFALILFSLRVLDAPGVGTFAADARHRLYVDFEALAAWSALENAEALLHECGHLFRDHAVRAEAKCVRDGEHTAWYIAADAMLNLDLVQAGCRTLGRRASCPRNSRCPTAAPPSGTSTSSGRSSPTSCSRCSAQSRRSRSPAANASWEQAMAVMAAAAENGKADLAIPGTTALANRIPAGAAIPRRARDAFGELMSRRTWAA